MASRDGRRDPDLDWRSPLCDLGTATFRGSPGGLYPHGTNHRPSGHEEAGLRISREEIIPRDAFGHVARMDFFKGAGDSPDGTWQVWLGQSTGVPYSVTWDYDPALAHDPAGGTFILTARATGDLGAIAEHSVTVKISGKK